MSGRVAYGDEVWQLRFYDSFNRLVTATCPKGCTEHCHAPKGGSEHFGCRFKPKHEDCRCTRHTLGPVRQERQRRRRQAQNEHHAKHSRPVTLTTVLRMPLRQYLQLAMVGEALEEL